MNEWDFEFAIEKGRARILKWTAKEEIAEVPEEIEGAPVTELADYAFAGGPFREIVLPGSIRRIGRYGFYNCFSLEKLSFHTSIRDVGAGAFTGCHRVRELEVTEHGQERSCFRDVLSEFSEELLVTYHGEGEARLMFPEFYEEGVENTPARILMTQVHGSGLLYRNCFRDGKLQFGEYDARFAMAKAQESEEFLIRLSLGRLYWPWNLEPGAREEYEAYIMAHQKQAGEYLIQKGETELMLRFAEETLGEKALLEEWVLTARSCRQEEILSGLMDLGHRRFPARRREFTL